MALANKEALVCGGTALLDLARSKGATITPVDSEHSAMYQCLLAGKRHEVSSLLLTASGGPFRTGLDFEDVDPEKFRCLSLARSALRIAGDGPMLFNAAKEVAVAAFMSGRLGLLDIAGLIEECLEQGAGRFTGSLDETLTLAAEAMHFCRSEFEAMAGLACGRP